jgi:hypothetical protein
MSMKAMLCPGGVKPQSTDTLTVTLVVPKRFRLPSSE